MQRLGREALIDRIMRALEERTGRRFAPSDIRLTPCPSAEPNWTFVAEKADPIDLDRCMVDLAEFDLDDEAVV